jgi:hypothetical protein
MLLQRDERGAEQWWDKGLQLYNGTGFKDLAFNSSSSTFDTYKLGLCLWTARQINYTENGDFRRPGLAKLEDDMWHMHLKPQGGFYTGYNKDYDPVNSSTNTQR